MNLRLINNLKLAIHTFNKSWVCLALSATLRKDQSQLGPVMPVLLLISHVVLHGQSDARVKGRELEIGQQTPEVGIRHAFTILSICFGRVEYNLTVAEV